MDALQITSRLTAHVSAVFDVDVVATEVAPERSNEKTARQKAPAAERILGNLRLSDYSRDVWSSR